MSRLSVPAAPIGSQIIGVGIDAVDVERFRAVLKRTPRFADRVFTAIEREQCAKRGDLAQRLAARFAAKEATMKSMSSGLWTVGLDEMSTEVDDDGAPSMVLSGRAAARLSLLGGHFVLVSLTHTDTFACAVALTCRVDERHPHTVDELGCTTSVRPDSSGVNL